MISRAGAAATLGGAATALSVLAACAGGEYGARAGPAAAFELRLQETWSRFARVRRATPGTLVVVLPENARTIPPRATLARTAGIVGRGAFDSGAAAPQDTVVVEFQRVRRLGPLEFGARRTRFTFLNPPAADSSRAR